MTNLKIPKSNFKRKLQNMVKTKKNDNDEILVPGSAYHHNNFSRGAIIITGYRLSFDNNLIKFDLGRTNLSLETQFFNILG
jgi:hypothetical protein